MRRLLGLPFLLLLMALVPVESASAADPQCTMNLPATVTVTAPSTAIWPTFNECQGATARWFVFAPPYQPADQLGTIGVRNGVSVGAFRFRDSMPTGLLKTGTPEGFNAPSTTVKFGSRITLKGSRQDHLKVPLSGVISRYVAPVDGFRRWTHRTVAISYRDCTTCAWHFLSFDKTNQYGVFSLAAVSPTARYYRAKIGDTSTTWGSTSNSVFF